jgi:hypothetical protein
MHRVWTLVTAVLLISGGLPAKSADLVVSDVQLPNLRWGTQQASFTVTNTSDQYKTISVVTEMQFEGSYLSPSRSARTNYLIFDHETVTINPDISVPGNFGRAKATVKIYDVVDTLDPVFDNQKIYEQPFFLQYHVPDAVMPYLQERIDLPPRVNKHPDFDSDFSRILLLMITEGLTPQQIADLVECDVQFVTNTISDFMGRFYVLSTGSGAYKTDFPVITVSEAKQLRPIADRMADSLAAVITRNLPRYDSLMAALEAQGKLPEDTNNFVHGGTVLYHKYPVIAALLLWYDLGSQFITDGRPLRIFRGTDLCNARIRPYLYAVQGGDYFLGTHLYHEEDTGPSVSILYGDELPVVVCEDDFIRKGQRRQRVSYQIDNDYVPEAFIIDTLLVREATATLSSGIQPHLSLLHTEIQSVARDNQHARVSLGYRWYVWNLTATRTLKKLLDDGVIDRRRNGQFKFEAFEFGWK